MLCLQPPAVYTSSALAWCAKAFGSLAFMRERIIFYHNILNERNVENMKIAIDRIVDLILWANEFVWNQTSRRSCACWCVSVVMKRFLLFIQFSLIACKKGNDYSKKISSFRQLNSARQVIIKKFTRLYLIENMRAHNRLLMIFLLIGICLSVYGDKNRWKTKS